MATQIIKGYVIKRAFVVHADKLIRQGVDGTGGGVTDHGALTGLEDDDHPQYHTDARGDARYEPLGTTATHEARQDNPHVVTAAQAGADPAGMASAAVSAHEAAADPHPDYTTPGEVAAAIGVDIATHAADPDAHHAHANKAELDLVTDGDHDVRDDNPHAVTAAQAGADPAGTASSAVAAHESTYDHDLIGTGGGATDHGTLTGLEDDDHPQYHTDARGDARYEPLGTTATHEARQDNPHVVTAAQAGADPAGTASAAVSAHEAAADPHPGYRQESDSYSDVETDAAIDADIATHAADADAHHAHANKVQLDLVTDGDHDVRDDNPHGVTAAQAGADPTGTAASAVAAHESTYDHDLIGTGGTGGGPRSGCTANETIAAGEVGVIEPGTTTISKVKISATSYTFAEIQQTIIDTYGESNASTWMDIFRVDAFRFFVVFNGREDGMYYPTPRCCVVSATPAGFVVGDVFEAGFASGSARYYSAGQFSAGRFLLYERSQEQAIIATVTGAAVTFTSVFSLDIGGDAYYPAFEAARDGVLLAMTQDVSTNEAVLSLIRDDGDNAMTLTSITVTGYQPSGQPCLTRVRSGVFLSRIQSGGGASAPWFVAVSVVGDVIGYGTPVDSGSAVLAGEITFTVLDETRVFAAWGYTTDLAGCVLTVGGLTVTPGGIVVLEDFLPGASSRGMSSVLLDDEHVGIATYAYNTTSAYVTVANIVAATGVQWTNPVDTLTVPAKAAVTSCRMLHALGAGTGLWATCGNVILLRFAYTGIEVSNIDGAIVVIDQGGNVGDPLTFWPLGEVAESFTGLVPGMDYYLDEDGSMSMVKTPTSRYIGTALTADDMLTVPMILNKFQPHAQGTDETLAAGTINECSAGQLRTLLDAWRDDALGVTAPAVAYDPGATGLSATTVAAALAELKALIDAL